MYGYIYETTCIPTGKKYIGMHKCTTDTIDSSYIGSGIVLRKAINKYGRNNFTCRILEWCETRDELSEKEREYISKTKAPISNEYYNVNDGGFGGHSEFYKQPMTDSQLNALEFGRHLPASDLLKKKLSEYRKNVIVSNTTRDKLRKNQIGKKVVNNGTINKYVSKNELDTYLSDGWALGFCSKTKEKKRFVVIENSKNRNDSWKKNLSNAFKGRRWVNDGTHQKQIHPDELESYLTNGFVLGRIK